MKTLFAAASLLGAAGYPFYVVHRQTLGEHAAIERTPAEWGARFEPLTHRTSDGLTLRGWWIPGGEKAVLLLHGKGGNRNGRHTAIFSLGEWYWKRGYSVMMADMRAHGESEGRYIYFGVREHMDMLGWLRSVDAGRRYRWILHGFSMGAVTALMMKEKEPERFETVVADAPWIDFEALVRQELWNRAKIPAFAYPYVRWIAASFFGQSFKMADNTARVGRLCGERIVYIFESEDALLPPTHRKIVETKCPDAKVALFGGVGHVAAFRENPRAYLELLEAEGL